MQNPAIYVKNVVGTSFCEVSMLLVLFSVFKFAEKFLVINEIELIQQKIYEVKGKKVMFDSDLAAIYGVETKRLKEAVRRNIRRFPSDFMFEVTSQERKLAVKNQVLLQRPDNEEDTNLRTQIATSSWGGSRYNSYAFTELGVAMLSSVLNSDIAIDKNIKIMRAFVAMRSLAQYIADNYQKLHKEIGEIRNYIEEILEDQNDINEDYQAQLDAISIALSELQNNQNTTTKRRQIGYRK